MARRAICFALTASAGGLAAAGGAQDAEVLVQTRLSANDTEEVDVDFDARNPCRCMIWAEAFTVPTHHIKCGDGPSELAWTRDWKDLPPSHAEDVCERFFQKFKSRACLTFKHGTRNTDQWCLVDQRCKAGTAIPLNPKHRAGTPPPKVGYRMCEEGTDTLMRDQTPKRILELAAESHVDPAMLIRWAYPAQGALEGKVRWPGIEEAMGRLPPGSTTDVAESKQVLKVVKKSNKPMIFEAEAGRYGQFPFGFVWGGQVWEVNRTAFFRTHERDLNALEAKMKFERVSKFSCIEGCQ